MEFNFLRQVVASVGRFAEAKHSLGGRGTRSGSALGGWLASRNGGKVACLPFHRAYQPP